MKRKLLIGLLLFFFVSSLHAQNWRYGKRGGSADPTSIAGHPPDEDVFDMATDNNGNVYVLASVMQTSLNVDGHALTGYGYHDVLIYSFKCDGTFRWVKLIGAAGDDLPYTLSVDKLGGVYVTFLSNIDYSPHASAEIGGDTTLLYTDKSFFMVKYDTAGHYKWLLAPQADTVSSFSYSRTGTIDMNVDSAGNVSWLAALAPGAYANGAFIATGGLYILKYSSAGIFQNAIKIQIANDDRGIGLNGMRMQTNPRDGKIYISGEYEDNGGFLVLGTDTLKHGMYISCFDRSGTFLWEKEDTLKASVGVGFSGRPVIDGDGNIYAGGRTPGNNDYFNGYSFAKSGMNGSAFIVKLDSNGNNIWMHDTYSNTLAMGGGVALRNNGEVILAGSYTGLFKWVGTEDSLYLAPNVGMYIYLARFNAMTGKLIGMDTIATSYGDILSCATNNSQGEKTSILSDGKDNVYVAGSFGYDLIVNGTTLYNAGGETDFFVAKYGFDNCGCSSAPAAAFSESNSHFKADFTYSGTAADSLRWDFGDGGTATGTNPSHTYADSGNYTVCVTIHAACGDDLQCQDIHVAGPISVATIRAGNGINVYPNPVSGSLYVAHATGAALRLFNIMGQEVYSGITTTDKQQIDMSRLAAGSYLLQLTDSRGNRTMVTVIKQ